MKKLFLAVFVTLFFPSLIFAQQLITDLFYSTNSQGGLNIISFYGSQTDIIIPNSIDNLSVTEIDIEAFKNRNLTSVVIPETVVAIGTQAFAENQITRITIGANVSLQVNSFDNNFSFFYNSHNRAAGTYTLSAGRWQLIQASAQPNDSIAGDPRETREILERVQTSERERLERELAAEREARERERAAQIEASERERAAAIEARERRRAERREARERRQAEQRARDYAFWVDGGRKLFSVGVNAGSSFASPVIITNLCITMPIAGNFFVEAGVDYGFINGMADDMAITNVNYTSWYYYGRINYFSPNGRNRNNGGWYIGIGGGYMMSQYIYTDPVTNADPVHVNNLALDVATGWLIGRGNHLFRLGYAARTNFYAINHRVMLGYTLRIGPF